MVALPACLQPRLGLEIMGAIPPGCFGYLVDNDDSEPVLSDGEFAVIDTTAREPENGALFLIQWNSGDREIVETFARPIASDGVERLAWWTGQYSRPRSREEVERFLRKGRTLSTVDGPYARTEYLVEKLVGKVVGVLAPDRHTRAELQRRRDVSNCPPHILADGYEAQATGYVEPAGSASYRNRTA